MRRNGGVEAVDAGPVEPDAHIVVALVGVQAVEFLLRQHGAQFIHRPPGHGHIAAVVVPLAVFGDRDVHAAVQQHKAGHRGQQHAREAARRAAAQAQQPPKQRAAEHADRKQRPEAQLVVDHAEAERALVIRRRYERKRRRGQRDAQHQAQGAADLGTAQAFALQRPAGGRAQHEQRHIVPAGIVARIERIEQAVERRDERAERADLQQARKRMPPPDAAERNAARQPHDRQVGRKAGPFGHTFAEQVGQIGGVRHQESAEQNRQVLLRFAVNKITVAVKRVDRARVLQKRQPRRDQQHAPGRAAEQRLERKAAEGARRQPVDPARAQAEKIEQQKHGLPGKEEIVGQQVERGPEREAPAPAVQNRVVKRCEHIREQRGAVQKEEKEDVIDIIAAERVQHRAGRAPVFVFYPAAQPQVRPAARHGKLQAEHRDHRERHPARRHPQREPEKRRTEAVVGVGVDKAAAEVGRPAERPAALDKVVGVGVKRDHLVVEVPGIVEERTGNAVHDAVRQKQRRSQRQAQKKHAAIAAAARPLQGQCHIFPSCCKYAV